MLKMARKYAEKRAALQRLKDKHREVIDRTFAVVMAGPVEGDDSYWRCSYEFDEAEKELRKLWVISAGWDCIELMQMPASGIETDQPLESPAQWAARTNNRLGVRQRDRGDFEGALACFRQALTHRPDYVLAHYNAGALLERLGRYEEAGDHYGQAIHFLVIHEEPES
jgi:tetratricopeptide (TPR) repeat protein